ncbi:hypothetical protein YC2023_076772 [Brassica napus]
MVPLSVFSKGKRVNSNRTISVAMWQISASLSVHVAKFTKIHVPSETSDKIGTIKKE